ncbi:MAG TPA: hypothetical protein DCQ98_15705 [Planctomycetaceae bacterium]|nr:hypothetical protein [Planctomycetaceae bacterium]
MRRVSPRRGPFEKSVEEPAAEHSSDTFGHDGTAPHKIVEKRFNFARRFAGDDSIRSAGIPATSPRMGGGDQARKRVGRYDLRTRVPPRPHCAPVGVTDHATR